MKSAPHAYDEHVMQIARWLLIRRSATKPEDVANSRAFGRVEATVGDLARAAGTRWVIVVGCDRSSRIRRT
jgi:hypothetical protein